MDAAPAPPVKDFLLEADLLQYFEAFTDTLKVTKTSQLKFVVRDDLVQIGMSGPEQRRYKKVYARYFPNPYLSIFKKILGTNKRTEEQHIQEQEQPSEVLPFFNSDKVSSKHVEYIIHIEDITINKELGMGQFGVVQQGTWTTENQRVQVAIKCLGSDRMTSNSTEFLKEAAVMHTIDHPNIVRLYGVVLHMDSLMLVTELAPLRSLLECLNEIPLRPSFPVPTLCDFAEQICDGMTYLENKRLIHRDLAARNILVFTKDKVKISDFGLSRALGVGKDYYQTNYNVNLKLPVAWCAPECILYLRFTSASDVWAYAVCLWEMFTYGFQPWAAFSGQQILENIDEPNYQRLERPECCPDQYYKTMLECWSHDPQNRPKFKDLGLKLRQIRPEQVQAVTNSQRTEKRRNTCLEYKTGDVITILGKENSALWYGVLPGGACGLFDPNNTKPYVKLQRASSLSFHSSTSLSPSLGRSSVRLSGTIRSSLLRTDTKRHTVTGKRTIERSMISSPQSDVKHTGHIGLDGAYFGDLTFLDPTGSQPPRQVVTPYKPSVDLEQVPLINPNSPSHLSGAACSMPFPVHADELLNGPIHNTDEESQTKSQHKNEAKSNNTTKKKNLFDKAKSATISRLNKTNSVTNNVVPANDSHEYHEITDAANLDGTPSDIETETSNVPDSPTVPNSPMDFSQSLIDEMDTMFRNMDSKRRQEINRSCEENRCQSLNKFDRKKPPRPSIMKTMSAQEQKTLDTAVALANEITTRSMTDLGKEAVKVPASPSERMKFNFKLSSRAHPHTAEADKCSHHAKQERRNFSEEANSVPDIQSTLTKESKLAYTSLIEQPTITTSIISNMATGYVAMAKPNLKAKPVPKPLSGLDGLVFTTLRSSEIEPCDQDLLNVDSDEGINVIPLPPRNTKPKLIDKPRHFRKYPLILPNDSELQSDVITVHPVPKQHTNVYHNFPNFQQHNYKNKVENAVKCPNTVQYHNLNVIEEDQVDGAVKTNSENNPDSPKTEEKRFDVATNMPLEKETLTKDCTDHVSVEDLLEFADQKPCGRQRGVESDEVRIMCKVLKNEVAPSSCLESLELTNWNVHQAIKIMRIKISIGERTTLDECCKELSDCNGDVLKALSNLMTKYEKH